jgi:type IV pilus assembly protein PilA
MLQRFRDMRERDEAGFTLIELLVVILIIAILAAIAIPVFLRQREKAYQADVQSTLRNLATAAESFSTGNGGSYVGFGASTDYTDVRTAPTQVKSVPSESATGYCVQVTESRLGAGTPWQTGHFLSSVGRPQTGACPGP